MKTDEVKRMIKDNKGLGDTAATIRGPKAWEYDKRYRCVVTRAEFVGDDKLVLDIAIETSKGCFCNETIWFGTQGARGAYLDKFLDKAFPDSTEEITTDSILGKSFIGKFKENGDYYNIEAVDASNDFISKEELAEPAAPADEDELPFT